ncbi:MAG: phosphatase PAP2 family protein, partial [Bacteroidetes bacterium]
FVSSHASNFAGLAVLFTQLLKFEYRKIGWILAIWVGLIGYSRIYIGVHYPADVIGGIIFGSIVGWLVYKGVSKFID